MGTSLTGSYLTVTDVRQPPPPPGSYRQSPDEPSAISQARIPSRNPRHRPCGIS